MGGPIIKTLKLKIGWTNGTPHLDNKDLLVPFGSTRHTTYLIESDIDIFDARKNIADQIFNELELAAWHDFIIPTKRGGRLLKYLKARYEKAMDALPTNIKFQVNNEQVRAQIFLEYGLGFLEGGI